MLDGESQLPRLATIDISFTICARAPSGHGRAQIQSIGSTMDSILVAIGSLALLSILALLWLKSDRRKAEIKDLKHALSQSKGSNSSFVRRSKLGELKSKLDEALQELGGRINNLQKRVRQLEHRVTELEESKRRGSGKPESGKDSSNESIGPEELDSSYGSDHGRKDRRDYKSQKTGERKVPKQLKEDYNRTLNGDLARQEFQSRYEPVVLGIENEEERLNREEAPVLLQEDERGQYLSIETTSGHLVVPKLKLTLEDPTRRQAGYDEVFQCEKFPYNHPYVVEHLHRIARFVQRPDGTYLLKVPGRIDLQRYD